MKLDIRIQGFFSDDTRFHYNGSDIDNAIAELTWIESQEEAIKEQLKKEDDITQKG